MHVHLAHVTLEALRRPLTKTGEMTAMPGPIVRSGPSPEYSTNWDKAFTKKKTEKKKAASSSTAKKSAKKKKKS